MVQVKMVHQRFMLEPIELWKCFKKERALMLTPCKLIYKQYYD